MKNYSKIIAFKPVISLKTIYAAYIQIFNEVSIKEAQRVYITVSQ